MSTARTVIDVVGIAVAAAATISLWTFRVALAGRGRRTLASLLAGVEAILFVLVFTGLISNLGDPVRIVAYGVGVACGTAVGLTADRRLHRGQVLVRLIAAGGSTGLLSTLHASGWPATGTIAIGPNGPAATAVVAVDEHRVPELLALADALEPRPFVTVEQARPVRTTPLPAGFVQVGTRRTARDVRTATATPRGRRPLARRPRAVAP